MSSNLMDDIYAVYSRIDVRERQYTRFRMSAETMNEIRKLSVRDEKPCPPWDADCLSKATVNNMLFGIPIDLDNNVPFLTVKTDTETPQERRMKEFAEEMSKRGRTVVIQAAPRMEWGPPVPPPTLKALLKHWLKKVRGK